MKKKAQPGRGPKNGADNLYLNHAGKTTFIAQLSVAGPERLGAQPKT